MAWCPMSEQLPLVGAASLEATLSDQSLFDTSRSSSQTSTPYRLAGGLGNTCGEQPMKSCTEPSATSSTTETNCSSLKAAVEPGDPEQSHHGLAETPSQHHKTVVNLFNDTPRTSLPVHRSHSDTLPLGQQEVPPQAPACRTCAHAYHGGNQSIQEGYFMSACKQPMLLQQCNVITTVCRGGTGGEGGAQQAETMGGGVPSPRAVVKVEGRGEMGPDCKKVLCYGSYNQQSIVNSEDTFAAYCHPQPIPAPSQLLSHTGGARPSATNSLTLPRLISSVSETGLDAKHLLRCCNLNCSWTGLLPPVVPQSQKDFGALECCISPVSHVRTITRDTGTMTAHKELRDIGVQTGPIVTPHVFPQVCLVEESKDETSCSGTLKKSGDALKSPVKEVKWDAEGMTWEVYGASVDPEELGVAIQKHLELQIKETASLAAKLSRQDTNTSQQVEKASCQRKRSGIIRSIRTPGCCSRSTSAVD